MDLFPTATLDRGCNRPQVFVPSEFKYDLLDTVIKHSVQKDAIAKHLSIGNYELCKTQKGQM